MNARWHCHNTPKIAEYLLVVFNTKGTFFFLNPAEQNSDKHLNENIAVTEM